MGEVVTSSFLSNEHLPFSFRCLSLNVFFQGLVEMRDALSGILRQFGPSEADSSSSGETTSGSTKKAAGKKDGNKKDANDTIKVQDVKSGSGNETDADLPIAKSMRVHPGKVCEWKSNLVGSVNFFFIRKPQITLILMDKIIQKR